MITLAWHPDVMSYSGPVIVLIDDAEISAHAELHVTARGGHWRGTLRAETSLHSGFGRKENISIRTPDGREGSCFIQAFSMADETEAEISGSGRPPFDA